MEVGVYLWSVLNDRLRSWDLVVGSYRRFWSKGVIMNRVIGCVFFICS